MRINRGAMCDNTIFLHETASKLHGIVKMSRWIILSVLSLLLAACVSCDSIGESLTTMYSTLLCVYNTLCFNNNSVLFF